MRQALVTGGSRGIGKAVAKQLKRRGYNVCTPTRQEMDLASPVSVEQYLQQHKDAVYDVIVNNAGINDIHAVEQVTNDEVDRAMNINLISPLRIVRTYIPAMKRNQYGRIVNIGSIWSVVSKSGRVVYSMTKNGIHGLTNTLAVELAEYNILVNTVCPGFTLTELTQKNNTQEQIDEISAQIPMHRMAQPDEIAEVICFLASEKNTYVTGQRIAIDGGYTSI